MPDPTIAYQSYQDAKKRGDEWEAVRLWVEYLDAVRGDMKEKEPVVNLDSGSN